MPEKQFTWDQLRDAIWDELKESEFVGEDNNRAHIVIGIAGAAVDRIKDRYHSESAGVWVKCKDRYPTVDGKYFMKNADGKSAVNLYQKTKDYWQSTEAEWLDESPARNWIMEGRGSYPYNDDRYKEEVRYLYDEVDALFKSTWAQIKSKTFEYRNKIIEQNKKEAGKNTQPTIGELWDELSELIEDNIDDLTRWAGSTVMVKSAFEKAVAKIGGDAGKEEAFFIVIEWLRKTIFKGDERINGYTYAELYDIFKQQNK